MLVKSFWNQIYCQYIIKKTEGYKKYTSAYSHMVTADRGRKIKNGYIFLLSKILQNY